MKPSISPSLSHIADSTRSYGLFTEAKRSPPQYVYAEGRQTELVEQRTDYYDAEDQSVGDFSLCLSQEQSDMSPCVPERPAKPSPKNKSDRHLTFPPSEAVSHLRSPSTETAQRLPPVPLKTRTDQTRKTSPRGKWARVPPPRGSSMTRSRRSRRRLCRV